MNEKERIVHEIKTINRVIKCSNIHFLLIIAEPT
jgi:hypothetical protein